MEEIILYLTQTQPVIGLGLALVATLYVTASEIIRLTPSPADDEALTKLEKMPILGAFLQVLKKISGRKP